MNPPTLTRARAIAKYLGKHWRQNAFVENRPGAGGTIGTEVIAKAPADGYHYIMGSMTTHAINASLYRRLPFDVVWDFTPISSVADLQAVLVVHPSVPVKTISELLRIAKAKPGNLTYGSAGNGSIAHMTTVLFQNTTGTRLLHVPFKGDAPTIFALTGGQIDMMFATLPAAIGQIRGGRLKAIAVSGPKRSPAIPDLPTVSEAGVPGFHVTAWFGLLAPANLPREITQKMNADLVGILRRQDMRRFRCTGCRGDRKYGRRVRRTRSQRGGALGQGRRKCRRQARLRSRRSIAIKLSQTRFGVGWPGRTLAALRVAAPPVKD